MCLAFAEQFQQAYDDYQKSLSILESVAPVNKRLVAATYHDLALTCIQLSEEHKALEYYCKAAVVLKEQFLSKLRANNAEPSEPVSGKAASEDVDVSLVVCVDAVETKLNVFSSYCGYCAWWWYVSFI